MIGYLEGTVQAKWPHTLLIATTSGVGYEVWCPAELMASTEAGQPLQVFVATVVRETEITLYGFASVQGRSLFQMLLKASGVGPKLALTLLSHFSPEGLVDAILQQNATLLATVPGVGKKTASKLCLELADRLAKSEHPSSSADRAEMGANAGVRGDLVSALTNLGFPEKDVILTLQQLPTEGGEFSELLKKALGLLR